jgi:hypothetical protein
MKGMKGEEQSKDYIMSELYQTVQNLQRQLQELKTDPRKGQELPSGYVPAPPGKSANPFDSFMSEVMSAQPGPQPSQSRPLPPIPEQRNNFSFKPLPTSNFQAFVPKATNAFKAMQVPYVGLPPQGFPMVQQTVKADLKFPEPKSFSGRREDCRSFLHDVETYFLVTGATDESLKIMYTFRLLETGLPMQWKRHQELMWTQKGVCPFSSWMMLRDEIWTQFGPIAEEEKAQRDIQTIRQKNKSIDEFNREFLMLAHQLPAGWEQALVVFYKQAINPNILSRVYTVMVMDPPKTLQEWINTTHMLHTRDLERQANMDAYAGTTWKPTPLPQNKGIIPRRGDDHRVIPTMREGLPQRKPFVPFTRRPPISTQFKPRPTKPNNACHICDKEGHWAADCPDKGKSRIQGKPIRMLTADEMEYLTPEEIQDWQERKEEEFAQEMDRVLQVRRVGVRELYHYEDEEETPPTREEQISHLQHASQDFH